MGLTPAWLTPSMGCMRIDEVRNLLRAHPFQPFSFHLPGGREIDVRHRDFIMASPSGRMVIVYQPDDSFNVIDLMLVSDLEVKPDGMPRSGET